MEKECEVNRHGFQFLISPGNREKMAEKRNHPNLLATPSEVGIVAKLQAKLNLTP